MRKIFISYRRAEAEYAAGALGRELRRHFGNDQVFRDKEDIGGGVSWKQHVLDEIDEHSAMLVLMGKNWAHAADAQGMRRLDNPDDPIRIELTDGLTQGAAVIPVLLADAQMPSAADLPSELKAIAELNAVRLRDGDWHYDLDRICKTLERAGFKPASHMSPIADATVGRPASPAPTEKVRGVPIKLIASYVLGVLALGAYAETHDSETYWGLALLSVVALVLAVAAYRDYQRGRSNSHWSAIGAIALASLGTLGYAGWALDDDRNSKSRAQAPAEPKVTPPPAPAGQPLASIPAPPIAPSASVPATNAPPPAAASEPPSIAGRWKDADDDTAIMFSQDGNRVHMVATQQGIVLEGSGSLSGRQLRMKLTMAGIAFADMQLTLSPDGRALQGTMSAEGKIEQVKIVR